MISKEGKWEAEGHARTNLVHWVPSGERVTYRDVEAEIIAHAVDQPDKAGESLLPSKLVLIEKLGDGANRPTIWPFDNSVEEEIAMMVAGERSLGIQVDGAPIPALRTDAGEARANAGIAGAVRKKDAKFSRNAWAGLILQAPGTITRLRNAPAAVRLVGPIGESGVCPWPSKTASQPSLKP